MQLMAATIFVLALSLLVIYLAVKVMMKKGWLAGFFRGLSGLALSFVGVFALLAVIDIFSYRQIIEEETISTLSFEKTKEQTFKATLLTQSSEKEFLLKGDQWQLDVRMLSWSGPMSALGVTPSVKLDRLSGRYLSLEQERAGERTVYSLAEAWVFDYWSILQGLPWFEAKYGSATFLPMVDGGIFEVKMTARGILAKPLNDAAKVEVDKWQ